MGLTFSYNLLEEYIREFYVCKIVEFWQQLIDWLLVRNEKAQYLTRINAKFDLRVEFLVTRTDLLLQFKIEFMIDLYNSPSVIYKSVFYSLLNNHGKCDLRQKTDHDHAAPNQEHGNTTNQPQSTNWCKHSKKKEKK